jgi:hypothetical protein
MKQNNAVAIISDGRPRMPTVERNSSILRRIVRDAGSGSFNVEPVNEYTPLATREDAEAMRDELSRALVPAEDKQIKTAVAMLVGAYRKSDLENPDIFVRIHHRLVAERCGERFYELVIARFPQLIVRTPQREGKESDSDSGKSRNAPFILLGKITGTNTIEVEPYDRASDNGWTLLKGGIGFCVLAIFYAVLKRL